MARTFGGVATDRAVTSLTAHATERTYAIWVKTTGTGGGGLGRIFDKRVSASVDRELLRYDSNSYVYQRNWNSVAGQWSIAAPDNAWHHVALSYDASSAANDPLMYLDGASQVVTEGATPSGTLQTNTDAYVLGNRGAAWDRNWAGDLAEFAVWDAILTPAEIAALAAGAHPLTIRPAALVSYVPLWGVDSPEPDLIVKGTAAVTGTAAATHPAVSPGVLVPQPYVVRYVGAAPANTVAPVACGTAQVGSALSTTDGTWTGSPTSYAYQWQRDNSGGGSYSNIGAATASSYTLQAADEGCNVRCVVTATNAWGSTAANSNALGPVTVVPPPQLFVEAALTDEPILGYLDTVLRDGPVAYWRMDDDGALSDETAHANQATWTGSSSLMTGALDHDDDEATSLDGATYATVPDSASLSPTAAVSVEAWLKLAALPASTMEIIEKPDSYKLEVDSAGHVLFTITNGDTAATVTSTATLPTSTWHHIAGVYDGARLYVYVDGIQDAGALASMGVGDSAEDLLVGAGFPPPPAAFPTTPVLDDFNRANEGPPPSASWATFTGSGHKVLSNAMVPAAADVSLSRRGTSFGAEAEIFATIATWPAQVDLFIKLSGTYATRTGYQVNANGSSTQIYKVVGGTPTQLGATDASVTWGNGDAIGFAYVGSTLTVYRRPSGSTTWAVVTTRTDTALQGNTGYIGIETVNNSTYVIDDFGGGTYVAPEVDPDPSPAICDLDEVAVYGSALTPSQVADHCSASDRVGWDGLKWTDLTDDGRSFWTKRGRKYELDRTETGTAMVDLRDLERLYDPSNEESALAPYLLPLSQLRIRFIVAGVSYGIFRGELEGFPTAWRSPKVAEHELMASDALDALANTEVTTEIPAVPSGQAAAALLDAAGHPRAARHLDPGGYTCEPISLDKAKALDPLQTIVDGEGGIAFCDGDGEITSHDKDHRFAAARSTVVQATWVDGASGPGDNVYSSIVTAPGKDRLINSWSVAAADGNAETARDDASIRLFRERPGSRTTYLAADGAAGVAATLVSRTAWPVDRIQSVSFMLSQESTDAEWISLLEREISDRVRIKATPEDGSALDEHYWIESIAWDELAPEVYRVTFSLTPVFAASYFTSVIATPGVVAYYRMASPDPLRDRSAYGNDGAMLGAVTSVDGLTTDGDEAESFDGSTQSGVILDSESLSITGELSLSFLLELPALPAATRDLISKRGSYLLQLDSTGHLIFTVKNGATTGSVTSATALSTDTPYHVACVYDGASLLIYLDSEDDATAAYSGGVEDSKMPLAIAKTFAVTTAPTVASVAVGPGDDDGNRTTDLWCAKPSGTAAGDLLIAQVATDSPNGATITGVPAGWTLVESDTHTKTSIYWKVAGSSEPATYH